LVSFEALNSLQFFLLKNVTHDLNVSCYNGQGHVTFKTLYPVVSATIQTVVFQSIYGRLDGRVLPPGLTKRFGVLDFFVDSRQLPFAGKNYESPCQSCNWSTAENALWSP